MDDTHEITFITVDEGNMSTPKPSGGGNDDSTTPELRNRNGNNNSSNGTVTGNTSDSGSSGFITDRVYLQSILKNNAKSSGTNRSKVNFSPLKQIVSYSDILDNHENVFCEKPKSQGQTTTASSSDEPYSWMANPMVPYTLSLYLQLAVNALISAGIIFLAYTLYRGIRRDVDHRIDLYTTDVMTEISHCSRDYYRNKCDGVKRPPALEKSCDQWFKCMNRDPQQIGTAKITAEAFADIVNGFVYRISWKFVIIVVAFFIGGLGFTNKAFSSYRHSLNLQHQELLVDKLQAEVRNHHETEMRLRTQVAALEKERDLTPNFQSAHSLFAVQASSNAFDVSPLLHRKRL